MAEQSKKDDNVMWIQSEHLRHQRAERHTLRKTFQPRVDKSDAVGVGIKIQGKDGIHLAKRYQPLERVGIYVPGGTAPLVSTVYMSVIPAKLRR